MCKTRKGSFINHMEWGHGKGRRCLPNAHFTYNMNLIKSKKVHKGGMGSKMFKKLSMWFIDYPQGKIGNDWYLILLYLFKGWQNYLRLARYVDLDGQVRSNFDVFCTASWNFFDVWSLVALWTGTVTRPFLLINTQSLSVFNCLKLAQFKKVPF